jgi:Bacteriophage tail sheath protein
MPTYLTPGVYRTTQVAAQPGFALVRTDIAGFLGFAERGPLPDDYPTSDFDAALVALKITSWKEFQARFGGFRRYGYLAYAVRAFFANGGDTCYVVRVAASTARDPGDQPAKAVFALPSGAAFAMGTFDQFASPLVAHFQPAVTETLSAGDILRVEGANASQLNHVMAVLGNGQVLLARSVDPLLSKSLPLAVGRFPNSCVISASSRGNWGNALRLQVVPLDNQEFGLKVTVDLGPEVLPVEDEFYRRLSLDPKNKNYAPTVLKNQSNLIRMEVRNSNGFDLSVDPALAGGEFYLQGGRDGLAGVGLNDFMGGTVDRRGLRLLEEIDEVSILACPDAVFEIPVAPLIVPPPPDPCQCPPQLKEDTLAVDPTAEPPALTEAERTRLQLAMIDQCERLRYRVAVLDPPDRLQITQMQQWLDKEGLVLHSSRFAAVYYPWLKVPDDLQVEGPSRRVPPSGHVAGAYAYTDLNFGVQKPPANVELEFASDVGQVISDLQQEGLNLNNVNAIRFFPGRGIRIWGERSLAPPQDSDWRFIHIRRLMSAIEKSAQLSSSWAVFQNNDFALRNSLKHSMTVLLQGIWEKGGLLGRKPADAFFVKCDTTNNPQSVIDQGQLICQVGVAIAAPMEFLVFEIRQDAAGAQVWEN